jgi:putative ABC transport system permease protein
MLHNDIFYKSTAPPCQSPPGVVSSGHSAARRPLVTAGDVSWFSEDRLCGDQEQITKKAAIGQNCFGRLTFQLEAGPREPRPHVQIVGLIRNTKYVNLREDFPPILYLAASQDTDRLPSLDMIVRSDLPLASLTRAISGVVPGSTMSYDTVSGYMRDSLVTERLMASLSAFFGVLATLIATIGVYGVMSYTVTRREVEIGVRMALGANPRRVVRMVLGESGVLLVVGIVGGIGLAIAAAGWAKSLLFQLSPRDPVSLVLAGIVLAVVGLCAAWIPARRAAQLAPTLALRAE